MQFCIYLYISVDQNERQEKETAQNSAHGQTEQRVT